MNARAVYLADVYLIDVYLAVGSVRTRVWVLRDSVRRSLEDWSQNVSALAERHRVYASCQLGVGRTGKSGASDAADALTGVLRNFTLGVMGALDLRPKRAEVFNRIVLEFPAARGL